jgi:uncharacterized protein (TIGR02996 family)
MNDESALLRSIQADPDDELARLVLADWLDDNGDSARAEFIRVQIELARVAPNSAPWQSLRERELRLLFENSRRWLGPFANADPPVFRYQLGTASIRMHSVGLLQEGVLPAAAEWSRAATSWTCGCTAPRWTIASCSSSPG